MATKKSKPPRRSLLVRLRGNFMAGIVIVAPVVLTAYLAWAVITFIDQQIVPWVPAIYNPRTYLNIDIPGFGVVVFLLFTTVVGYFNRRRLGGSDADHPVDIQCAETDCRNDPEAVEYIV